MPLHLEVHDVFFLTNGQELWVWGKVKCPSYHIASQVPDINRLITTVVNLNLVKMMYVNSIIVTMFFPFQTLLVRIKSLSPAHTQGERSKALPLGRNSSKNLCIHVKPTTVIY